MRGTKQSQTNWIGTISSVENHGSIIIVSLLTEGGTPTLVFFEHRSFRWMLDSEQCEAADLIGRQASYDGEQLNFLD